MTEWLVIALIIAGGGLALYAVRGRFQKSIVYDWDWGLHYRNGKFQGVLPSGAYRWIRSDNRIVKLDKRRQLEVIPGQEVLSKDNAGLKLSMLAEYRIADPVLLAQEIQDFSSYLHSTAQIAIREAVGNRELDEILDDRAAISREVLPPVVEAMKPLGVEVTQLQLRDIMLSSELRSGYTAVLTARKEGEAALERARGETAALRNLANAARMLKDNPDLIQLRLIQSMSSDTSGRRTFVIGVPPGSVAVAPEEAESE